jgi:ATP-dependent 26S proteasome regulatory subunit
MASLTLPRQHAHHFPAVISKNFLLRGVLLWGMPGGGKTMLGRSIAGDRGYVHGGNSALLGCVRFPCI